VDDPAEEDPPEHAREHEHHEGEKQPPLHELSESGNEEARESREHVAAAAGFGHGVPPVISILDRVMTRRATRPAPVACAALAMLAPQAGDQAGEAQPALPSEWTAVAAQPLSPEEARAAFTVAPGFRVELFAAEPLVVAPVALAFAPDGTLWAVEMPGYMSDLDGTREREPNGRVVRLEDTDGDGRADRRTVFLEGLVLPRGLAHAHGGVLVIEPPYLQFARDEDRDGKADRLVPLAAGFEGLDSPEHAGNALRFAHDGWWTPSQHRARFRFDGERVETQATPVVGQWGQSIDDFGRLYVTPNSEVLLVDRVPRRYAVRHPAARPMPGVPARAVADRRAFPVHRTPGVNRAYRQGMLDADGFLREVTAACGPLVYRDARFGPELDGDAFICESVANCVQRYDLRETADGPQGTPLGAVLAARDERFRPVDLALGPDGAIYVADFARGIIQHRVFMTSFLRRQVTERGLDRPVDRGRIWRLVPEGGGTGPAEDLSTLDAAELAARLAAPNGTVRDLARRLLVERRDPAAVPVLEGLLGHVRAEVRHQAAWTIETAFGIDGEALARIAGDADPRVRAGAAELAERMASRGGDATATLDRLARDPEPSVRLRAVLALGAADDLRPMLTVARPDLAVPAFRAAVVSAAAGRENALLAAIADGALDPQRNETQLLVTELVALTRSPEADRPMPDDGSALARGRRLYASCVGCHQADGQGMPPVYPPLKGSPAVLGDPAMLARILLHGLEGPLESDGCVYRGVMPAAPFRDDAEFAAVMTYIRQAWGNGGNAVGPELVARERAATRGRTAPWRAEDVGRGRSVSPRPD
jgi:glucose/arabinose dehydrogenase/mono/diheme cytochrome c family protein